MVTSVSASDMQCHAHPKQRTKDITVRGASAPGEMNIAHIALKHLKQSRWARMPVSRLMPCFTLFGGAALVHPWVPILTLQSFKTIQTKRKKYRPRSS